MSNREAWVHSLIKALLLIGFAAYIALLVKSGHIVYYISPRSILYVKLAALALYAAGAYQLYSAVSAFSGKLVECDCGHDHAPPGSPWRSALIYGLFALPLALGFLMPDTTMGSSLAAKKGMNLSSGAALRTELRHQGAQDGLTGPQYSPATAGRANNAPSALSDRRTAAGEPGTSASSQDSLFPAGRAAAPFAKLARELYATETIVIPERLYVETLTALDLYAARFAGKTVSLTGFVYRDSTMDARHFAVGRFSVQCCSADASPVGMLVQDDRAGLYATDQWVRVTGTLGTTRQGGSELLVVRPVEVRTIGTPKEPYVYPDAAFGSKAAATVVRPAPETLK
ncbi:TIGR03943 family putative permease subunit [Paenibacillus hodogayensis]|uniref:TIGR03943 family putative permease subunit n=1 Tax=Paenibacillus hodogayensis TaxID=279208 RepID=A0ABV5VTY0_9BACL